MAQARALAHRGHHPAQLALPELQPHLEEGLHRPRLAAGLAPRRRLGQLISPGAGRGHQRQQAAERQPRQLGMPAPPGAPSRQLLGQPSPVHRAAREGAQQLLESGMAFQPVAELDGPGAGAFGGRLVDGMQLVEPQAHLIVEPRLGIARPGRVEDRLIAGARLVGPIPGAALQVDGFAQARLADHRGLVEGLAEDLGGVLPELGCRALAAESGCS